ncbi:hypothetical protein KAR91_67065 [Candidatus Pacearchaeota archaeon]|nr:hypothetical protein [Candidatus Pacearchaeota archaeon]
MAGSGRFSMQNGMKKGFAMGAGAATELIPEKVEKGNGTPTHVSPEGTIYVKMDATMGTTSHYRMVSGTWTPMSDD